MITAFQPNAFQNNAFQIDSGASGGAVPGVLPRGHGGALKRRHGMYLPSKLKGTRKAARPQPVADEPVDTTEYQFDKWYSDNFKGD